ncbi:MAG: Na(+)-translocating NADH-quinone reductase subunit C, partial [Natronospirillum sp.]
MANKESLSKTLTVAALLCIVCSVVVSMAAVLLRPAQEANRELDFRRNILAAAGLLEEGRS